jgi:hypothetical protein
MRSRAIDGRRCPNAKENDPDQALNAGSRNGGSRTHLQAEVVTDTGEDDVGGIAGDNAFVWRKARPAGRRRISAPC